MKLDVEATKKAGHKVYFGLNKSQPKVEKSEKKPKKVEILEEKDEVDSFSFRDEE